MSNQDKNISPYSKMMPSRIEYKTLFNKQVGQLDDEVNEHLNEGWQPAGPQYYTTDQGWFVQPLIRVPQQMMRPQ